jgi:hypothetical protein
VLGERFDPTVLAMIRKAEHLSGGAGASAQMALDRNPHSYSRTPLDTATRAQLVAQATPERTYQCYLEWLSAGRFDPEVALFTEETRRYLSGFPMSKAYFDHILFVEFGKAFKVDVRGDLAFLYFTNDPFAGPHFFRRRGDRWYMDLNAEVQNTVNRTGGVYTWDYRGRTDDFSKVFADKFVDIGGYVRVADGDNRALPTRKTRVAAR